MTTDNNPESGRAKKRTQRAQKLKSELRANLKKRKDQARKLSSAKDGEEKVEFSVKLRDRNIAAPDGKDK